MENKKLTTSLVAGLLIATNIFANELSTITVTSSLIETNEKDATYTTEIYTKKDIQNSRAKDVYDFFKLAIISYSKSKLWKHFFSKKLI